MIAEPSLPKMVEMKVNSEGEGTKVSGVVPGVEKRA
jgi:hypothetical protein